MSLVQDLEFKLDRIKQFREQANAALRLTQNQDFRKLILEGFCRDEVARLMSMATDPAITDPNVRASCLDAAKAGGVMKRFLARLIDQADEAERDIPQIEEMLAGARAEEAARDTSSTGGNGFTTIGGDPLPSDEELGG